jgi:hypothetical protein
MQISVAEFDAIEKREGFKVWDVRANGRLLRVTARDASKLYAFKRAMRGSCTVKDWLTHRFQPAYPGCTCVVLTGDGRRARGNMRLSTVRRTY